MRKEHKIMDSQPLPFTELKASKKQYEYYRELLLTFPTTEYTEHTEK
jgi:hypothetical protein